MLFLLAPTISLAQAPGGGLRQACRADYSRFCAGTRPGGGRILKCLRANGPSLSPPCQHALLSLRH